MVIRSKERTERYQKDVKNNWDMHYNRNPWRTVHQAGSEQDNIDLAKKEVPLYLWPDQKYCEELYDKLKNKEIFDTSPTFQRDFYKHPPIDKDLSEKVALDYGCGSLARYSTEFAKRFKKVYSIDSSPFAVKYCKKYTDEYTNIEVIETNGTDLAQIKDESIDFVFSNLVFQHVGNKEIMLDLISEVFRVLRGEGIFRASFWTEEKPDDHQHAHHGTGFSVEGYEEVFKKAGFKVKMTTHEYPILWVTLEK